MKKNIPLRSIKTLLQDSYENKILATEHMFAANNINKKILGTFEDYSIVSASDGSIYKITNKTLQVEEIGIVSFSKDPNNILGYIAEDLMDAILSEDKSATKALLTEAVARIEVK